MPPTTWETYTNMQSHACPNQLGNHTCKRLPASKIVEASWSYFPFLDPCLIFLSLLQTRVLQENSEWPRECERENNERAPNLNLTKATNWSSETFFMHEASNFFIFIMFFQFPPHMQQVTFPLTFLLISLIFINKCAKNVFCPFQASAFAFANFP